MNYNDNPIEYLAKYPNALPPGTPLKGGIYKVMNVLGQGSFGITYLAVTRDNQQYAVKEYFHKAYCERSENNRMAYSQKSEGADEVRQGLEYFKQEARMLVQMTSDNRRVADTPGVSQKTALLADANYNIVKVTRTFDENDTCYFVMEYLDGGSLTQQINGPMDEAKAISLITPIAWAVQHLHDNYMMHMDIKPDNIVLASNGDNEYKMLDPKLIDFGTTLRYNSKKELTTTSLRKKAFGTPGYCSREHDAILTFAPHLDVYSLGATLLHMLTGMVPLDKDHVHEALDQLLNDHNVSQRTQQAIKHAMSYKAQDRTQSAIDFINELAPPFLPIGYTLRSIQGKQGTMYRILNVERQEDDYISYRAYQLQRGTAPIGQRHNSTKEYIIHECFARMLCHRTDNMTVVADKGEWAEMDKREFMDHVVRNTGLTEELPLKTDKSGRLLAELFNSNDTLYSVKRKGYSAQQDILLKRLKTFCRRMLIPLCACIMGFGIGMVISNHSDYFKGLLSSCSNPSIINDSIEKIDAVDTIQIVPSEKVTEVRYVKDSLITIPIGRCRFTGEVNEKGIPDGKGIATFIGGNIDGNVYNGFFKDGILEGDSVRYTYKLTKDVFVGTFHRDTLYYGRLIFYDNPKYEYYEGRFEGGQPVDDKGLKPKILNTQRIKK